MWFADRPGFAIFANLTMLQSFIGIPNAIGVYWTLNYELVFYILCSILFGLKLLRYPALITSACLFATISICVALQLSGEVANSGEFVLLLFIFTTMFVGFLARAVYDRRVPRSVARVLVACTLATITLNTGVPLALAGRLAVLPLAAAIMNWCAAYSVFGLALALNRRPFPRPLVNLGKISYSIYLLHDLVLAAIPGRANGGVTILIWFVVVVALSTLTHRWLERPGIAFGRRLVAGSLGVKSLRAAALMATRGGIASRR